MIDIIIPTYKNKQGLKRTLESINTDLLDKFTITVIDDYSNLEYNDIQSEFPFIHFYPLQQNVGPGMARQFGINHTKQPYILFIDTEDVFYNFSVQIKMIKQILQHPQIYIFSWQTYISNKYINKDNHVNLHGRIFKREFLQKYNITFSKKGSYANQDVGFIRFCKLILKHEKIKNYYLFIKKPLIIYTLNPDSITRTNYHLFRYTSQNLGLAYNEKHVIEMMENNNCSIKLIQQEIDFIMINLYKNFYQTLQECPRYVLQSWQGAKYFYITTYSKYENIQSNYFQLQYSKLIKWHRANRQKWIQGIPLNINRFLQELKTYENIPDYYLTFIQDYDILNT